MGGRGRKVTGEKEGKEEGSGEDEGVKRSEEGYGRGRKERRSTVQ